jgi:hypothetical protein
MVNLGSLTVTDGPPNLPAMMGMAFGLAQIDL